MLPVPLVAVEKALHFHLPQTIKLLHRVDRSGQKKSWEEHGEENHKKRI